MFKPQGLDPVTQAPIVNDILEQKDYFISYDPRSSGFGCETTAIVFGNHDLFFTLKGDHKAGLAAAVKEGGKAAVVDYYIANIDQAHAYSEHKNIFREDNPFHAREHAEHHLGQDAIDRLRAAVEKAKGVEVEEIPEP